MENDINAAYTDNAFFEQIFNPDVATNKSLIAIVHDIPGVKAFLEEKDPENMRPKDQIIPIKLYITDGIKIGKIPQPVQE